MGDRVLHWARMKSLSPDVACMVVAGRSVQCKRGGQRPERAGVGGSETEGRGDRVCVRAYVRAENGQMEDGQMQ